MSEWGQVLAVFWALWALDGGRMLPRRMFTFRWGGAGWGGVFTFSRLSRPGILPWSGRATVADVPLSVSSTGICNQPVGSAGRPVESPALSRAWLWADVREVGVAKGWLFVNGERFCPDSGHLPAPVLLALAQSPAARRRERIDAHITGWLRPAMLRRRRRVLQGRTTIVAWLNGASLLGLLGTTLYLAGDLAGRVPAGVSERVAALLPWWLGLLLGLHVAAVSFVWRVLRRLRPVGPEQRGTHLLSALLLPPQALRLRALLADGFFPIQHPLAWSLAVTEPRTRRGLAFNVVADLRWPTREEALSPVGRTVVAEFRSLLEPKIAALLAAAEISPAELLAPPIPDAPGSTCYCPRCRDQFTAGGGKCPQGIELQPLRSPARDPATKG